MAKTMSTLNGYEITDKIARESLTNKMESPATAQVGEAVVIEGVDESGKPTKFKSMAFPASGATKEQAEQINKNKEDINKLSEENVNLNRIQDEIIDLVKLGVKEGSENAESNTAILQELVETYPKGTKTFYLDKGTYYFNPIDFTPVSGGITVKLKGKSYGLENDWFSGILTTIITNKQDFMYDKRNPTGGITFYVDNISFYSYQGYSEIPTGVCFGTETSDGAETNFHFHQVIIHGFDYGFKSAGYSCGGSGGKNFSFSTCHYGIYIPLASHLFYAENVELVYNRVGMRFGHGGVPCSIKNIHVATGYLGADKEEFDEYIVIYGNGNLIIEGLYQEAYEGTALPEKTILFDYEGWAYGVGNMIIKDTPIGAISGKGGKWLRARAYLGAYTGSNTCMLRSPSDMYTHYPQGAIKLENCRIERYRNNLNGLLELIDIFQDDTVRMAFGVDLGMDFYENACIITKDYYLAKINSFCKTAGVSYAQPVYDGITYTTRVLAGFDTEYKGFKPSTLFNKLCYKTLRFKGYIEVTEALQQENLNAVYGILQTYTIDGTTNAKFYPISNINTNTGIGHMATFEHTLEVPEGATGYAFVFANRVLDTENNPTGILDDIKRINLNCEIRGIR